MLDGRQRPALPAAAEGGLPAPFFEPIAAWHAPTRPPRVGVADRVPLFLHVPKTGGRSVEALFAAAAEHEPLVGRACIIKGGHRALGLWYHETLDRAYKTHGGAQRGKRTKGCSLLSGEWSWTAAVHPQNAGRYRPLTLLREPAARALSQLNHHMDRGRLEGSFEANAARFLGDGCAHSYALCRSLSSPNKCRLGGSCGLFRDHQTAMLAAPHGRSLPQLVSMARNSSLALEVAVRNLEHTEVVAVVEYWFASACLLAYELRWHALFEKCCEEGEAVARRRRTCAAFNGHENARAWGASEEIVQLAARANMLDRALYVRGYERFSAAVAAMERETGTTFGLPAMPLLPPIRALAGAGADSFEAASSFWGRAALSDGQMVPVDKDMLTVKPLGMVIFAAGRGELQKAFKSAASARRVSPQLEGAPLHITLVTDATGVENSFHFARAGIFDRVVSAFGRSSVLDEITNGFGSPNAKGIGKERHTSTMPVRSSRGLLGMLGNRSVEARALSVSRRALRSKHTSLVSGISAGSVRGDVAAMRTMSSGETNINNYAFMTIREAKQVAIRFGVALYERAVVVDADTFFCDDQALTMLANAANGADVVTVSTARAPKCEGYITSRYPRAGPEVNTGVLAFRSSEGALRLLERWTHHHRAERCNGQDQPAFRLAVAEATDEALQKPLVHLRLDIHEMQGGRRYGASDKPFNCRVRPQGDEAKPRDPLGQCAAPTYAHCSILHGHLVSGTNLREPYHSKAAEAPARSSTHTRGVAVFIHIPKTAGRSVKEALLPWLQKVRSDDVEHEKRRMGITERGLDLWWLREGDLKAIAEDAWSTSKVQQMEGVWQGRLRKGPVRKGALYYGSCSGGACEYLAKQGGRRCSYFTMLRDPIDRLISEHNWCVEVGWYGDQTCSGPNGADSLQQVASRRSSDRSAHAGFVRFARARGNVLVEHVAHSFTLADFAWGDHPMAWHDRDKGVRVTPMEARRARQGDSNLADLEVAKFMLANHFAVVGLTERFEESAQRVAHVLAGRELPESVLRDPSLHAHNAKDRDRKHSYLSREALSDVELKQVREAVHLDLLLYRFAVELFESRNMSAVV